jgi:hypothetical protein
MLIEYIKKLNIGRLHYFFLLQKWMLNTASHILFLKKPIISSDGKNVKIDEEEFENKIMFPNENDLYFIFPIIRDRSFCKVLKIPGPLDLNTFLTSIYEFFQEPVTNDKIKLLKENQNKISEIDIHRIYYEPITWQILMGSEDEDEGAVFLDKITQIGLNVYLVFLAS